MQIPFEKIENYYDVLVENEEQIRALFEDTSSDESLNPRDHLECRIGFTEVFTHLNKLLEINPKTIIDIGCGMNHFKEFIPHLIGLDPRYSNADIIASFDAEFSKQYTHSFDAAFSICALHFIPLDYMRTRILEFANIIKPGGRGYITLNLARLVEDAHYKKNTDYLIEMFGTENPSIDQCEDYVKKELDMLNLDMLLCEVDFNIYDAYYNGNIRLIFNA